MQAGSISAINGAAPTACIAFGTRFNRDLVSVELLDPPPRTEGTVVDIPAGALFQAYYEPIMELLGESDETINVGGPEVDIVRLQILVLS